MSKYFNRVTALIMGIGFSQLVGCAEVVESGPVGAHSATIVDCAAQSQQERGPLGALSCELGLSVRAAEPALTDELRQALGSYAQALQSNDAATVEKLLSAERRARIDEREQGADSASNLQSFVSRERRKLTRSVGTLKAPRESFTVTSAEVLADGSVAAIEVAVNGQQLPKPFYFVQEDGAYKLNIRQPDIGIASSSRYRVKNGDAVPRAFRCDGMADLLSVASQQEVRPLCEDTCDGDGTRFYAPDGAAADCDYNSWGLDMTIVNGYPVCSDVC